MLVLAGSLCARAALAEDKRAPAPAAPPEVPADGAVPMTAGERDRATEVAGILDGMARDAAAWLTRRALYARTVTIKVRYDDFTTITRSHTAPAPSGTR